MWAWCGAMLSSVAACFAMGGDSGDVVDSAILSAPLLVSAGVHLVISTTGSPTLALPREGRKGESRLIFL